VLEIHVNCILLFFGNFLSTKNDFDIHLIVLFRKLLVDFDVSGVEISISFDPFLEMVFIQVLFRILTDENGCPLRGSSVSSLNSCSSNFIY
jgi:hypothetical protein